MTVYVDDMRAQLGRMVMCHMVADTRAELDAMADRIGVARRWIQHAGRPDEHYDIALSKRALAVSFGAVEIAMHDVVPIIKAKRAARLQAADEGGG